MENVLPITSRLVVTKEVKNGVDELSSAEIGNK